ncbi:hypothetical protein A3B42_02860 [Candidatus Daviesbacteria bacterium RIFCSPLOWO2_01_FULL_38_10]|nr:MAG: hypothetical protein US80_C0004G0036 [Candidatus Daviesbacteria bacterium GW2011_GWA2_38_17]OGE26970.1 MAG: hypothetical protein A3D02_01250 [Candidatus Daviesbacteria bacterium RIFCSPHIGHO2_02_FULL_39_41]OGE37947.1 MAG: hypothetical protein A3B42_02860 [Candidatus Daviesbacteria bacterium RIFCSPLOWO2_01_FULL_38_10]OGE44045.1 MAG: hypothetical protein A3E67_01310 [Candidatus Daviesbacteria bacterium RIFCSPHIGHO2_12_FULL_38_25]OGE67253.1 MAG: hypothetical protein A3H81_05650 [Candidatus 
MNKKISINLLPVEYATEEIKKANFYKIQIFGIASVVIVTFLASLIVALGVLQSKNITEVKARLGENEEKVLQLKDRQALVFVIKNRLATINQYFGITSKQVAIYSMLNQLLPSGLNISSYTIDRSGEAVVVGVVSDGESVDNLIVGLTSKSEASDKISRVSIENLNRGRDGLYRISLKIQTK